MRCAGIAAAGGLGRRLAACRAGQGGHTSFRLAAGSYSHDQRRASCRDGETPPPGPSSLGPRSGTWPRRREWQSRLRAKDPTLGRARSGSRAGSWRRAPVAGLDCHRRQPRQGTAQEVPQKPIARLAWSAARSGSWRGDAVPVLLGGRQVTMGEKVVAVGLLRLGIFTCHYYVRQRTTKAPTAGPRGLRVRAEGPLGP